MPAGGYQAPRNPAPASGPGALSRRTDGGPADPQPSRWIPTDDFGGATEMQEVQQGAPMMGAAPLGAAAPLPAFDAPTERPDEPITAGAPFGPGPGPADAPPPPIDLTSRTRTDAVAAAIRAAYAARPSPALHQLISALERQGR